MARWATVAASLTLGTWPFPRLEPSSRWRFCFLRVSLRRASGMGPLRLCTIHPYIPLILYGSLILSLSLYIYICILSLSLPSFHAILAEVSPTPWTRPVQRCAGRRGGLGWVSETHFSGFRVWHLGFLGFWIWGLKPKFGFRGWGSSGLGFGASRSKSPGP